MEFKATKKAIDALRARKVVDEKAGTTRDPAPLELEAAAIIESLLFQLNSRIEKAAA